ncbi:hypothetical protein FC25_GL000509 [Ligilactobacillus ruminis DSM 20403 = NBRC 102161]|nr:hypothetical protein FC25_GL000509 [Ligilactobacillus ruminis DSM 20403 = NBRC 102161]
MKNAELQSTFSALHFTRSYLIFNLNGSHDNEHGLNQFYDSLDELKISDILEDDCLAKRSTCE